MRRPIKFRGKLNRRGRKLIKQVRKKVEAGFKNALTHYIGQPCPQTITVTLPSPVFEITVPLFKVPSCLT